MLEIVNFLIYRYYEDFKIDRNTGESNYTRLLADEAVSFLESQANQTAPFFLLWTPDATHAAHYASQDFLGKSRRGLFNTKTYDGPNAIRRLRRSRLGFFRF